MQKRCTDRALFYSMGVLSVAWLLDRYGEPPARFHPVVWYGKLIVRLQRRAPQGARAQVVFGASRILLATVAVLPPLFVVDRLLVRLRRVEAGAVGWMLALLLEGICLKPFFALHMLREAGKAVRVRLEHGDVVAARQALQSLVSREREKLGEELIAAATIESLAENLSDSVVAPLFYYALLGLPGAALYRLYNTFDSMIGYHGQYEFLGKAAARLDDVLNLLPARLTALSIVLGASLLGGSSGQAYAIWRRDAHKTASPNAGQPMAAMAGALGVQLEKVGHYTLGDAVQPLHTESIRRAERMVQFIGSATFVVMACLRAMWRR
jgi:adenosylcobinamide-phosphate synthase